MKNIILLIVLLVLSFDVFAANEQTWINVTSTTDGKVTYDVKVGSLEISKTKGGIPIAIVVGRIVNKNTQAIDLFKWYVSISDCSMQMGKLVALNISGEFVFESDFVFDSGNVSSIFAKNLCRSVDSLLKQENDKAVR